MRALACAAVIAVLSNGAVGQSFEIADVHISAKTPNAFVRTGPVRGGRYEVKNATTVDLVRIAYGFDPDKVLGGPSWLELDRFDVIAKVTADSTPDMQKSMLQALLADRFKLVVHKETRPLPTYALTAGKNPKLRQADSSGETGCKLKSESGPPADGGIRLFTNDANGRQTTITLGPGMTLQYSCRNMTMTAFATGLRGMMGASLGANPVLDGTGLKGSWNFDVKWSLALIGPAANAGDRITVFDALEKQLGLKLEQKQNPTPVIVVDSVNRVPRENPPGVAEALPTPPAPTEFEVANVKLADPDLRTPPNFRMQPVGRLTVQGMPMRFLIGRTFNEYSNDQLIGLPKWADSDRFDITALAPASALSGPIQGLDPDTLSPMMRALLADRFNMKYHTEERALSAYSLVSLKPKMKKADPDSRISCKNVPAPPGAAPGALMLTCQNTSMAQFAERLRNMSLGFINAPVSDATGMEGGWDFTLTFSPVPPGLNGPGRGGDSGQPANMPLASDPGGWYTIFEAIEKQLGLKLEMQKRTMPVIVFDHLEQKPTDD